MLRVRWTEAEFRALLSQIGQADTSLVCDWDSGPPEEWGTIMQGNDLIGLLAVKVPLCLLSRSASPAVRAAVSARPVVIVPYRDASATAFTFDVERGRRLVPTWCWDCVAHRRVPPYVQTVAEFHANTIT